MFISPSYRDTAGGAVRVLSAYQLAEDHNLPELDGQFFDGPSDRLLIVLAQEKLFGAHGAGFETVNFLIKCRCGSACPLLLEERVAGLADNRKQPCATVRPVEPAKKLQGAQVRCLYQVLRVTVVAGQPAGQVVRGIQMG